VNLPLPAGLLDERRRVQVRPRAAGARKVCRISDMAAVYAEMCVLRYVLERGAMCVSAGVNWMCTGT